MGLRSFFSRLVAGPPSDTSFSSASLEDADSLIASARKWANANNLRRALDDLDKAIKVDPTSPSAYFERSKIHQALGDGRAAEKDLKVGKLYLDKLDQGLKALEAGTSCYDNDDFKGAIKHFNEAVSMIPTLMDVRFRRGQARRAIDDFAGAIQDFDSVIASSSSLKADAYYERGLIRSHKLKDSSSALEDFNAAISLDQSDYRYWLSRSRLQADDFDGLDDLNQALKLDPLNVRVLLSRALQQMGLANYTEATADLTALIELNSPEADISLSEALALRASIHTLSYDLPNALQDYNRAIVQDAGNVDALFERGEVKRRLDDLEGAIDDFTKVIQIRPDHAESFHFRGLAKAALDITGWDHDLQHARKLGYSDA